jgi:ADP-ribose pyrophosphatase YjhB (NUDIX family)
MTTTDAAAWYATLPTMFGAAAALFTDEAGRLLLVKPNYRDHWSLPGGVLEHGEAPHVGCAREVAEELGIDIQPGPLLAVGWAAPEGDRPKPIVHWIFDGGELAAGTRITLQQEELDDYRFVDHEDTPAYLPPMVDARVTAAFRARLTGAAAYVPYALRTHALGSRPCHWH